MRVRQGRSRGEAGAKQGEAGERKGRDREEEAWKSNDRLSTTGATPILALTRSCTRILDRWCLL